MTRRVRIQYPGAIYHVMNRGDHKERIFCDDQDRQQFLATLEEVCQKTAWHVHAFCLMSNHFHLVVETPTPNLVEGMTWFLKSKAGVMKKDQAPHRAGRYTQLARIIHLWDRRRRRECRHFGLCGARYPELGRRWSLSRISQADYAMGTAWGQGCPPCHARAVSAILMQP